MLTKEVTNEEKGLLIINPELEVKVKKKSVWSKIAINELKLRTSKVRENRKLFWILIFSIALIWAFMISPLLFDAFMPQIAQAPEISGFILPLIATIIEYMMMIFFLMLVIYPLSIVYRKDEISLKESILASPATAGDIFLGEFIGKMPIYLIAVLIFSPIILGLVNPLIEINIFQYSIIFCCIFGLVMFANLLGTILASWISKKITQSEKARDWGKALIMVVTIIAVAIMYGLMYFLKFLMENQALKNLLNLYPSYWFSNIILYIFEPMLIEGYLFNIWISFLLAISIPLLSMYISYKKASSFYSLEYGIEKSSSKVKRGNILYRIFMVFLGVKWGGLVSLQFKRFFRKKENIARLAYVFGLTMFMSWFMLREIENLMEDPVLLNFVLIIGGAVSSVMLGNLIFVDSKDILWIFKRSPRGINHLVYSYLISIFLINTAFSTILTIFLMIFIQMELLTGIIIFTLFLFYIQITICQIIGIQCFNPAFEVKGKTMQTNTLLSMALFQIPLVLLIVILFSSSAFDLDFGELMGYFMSFLFLINGILAAGLLYIGLKKLNKIE